MNISGIGQNYYQNNILTNKYNQSKAGAFYQQKQMTEEAVFEETRQNVSAQDIYEMLKAKNPYAEYETSPKEKLSDDSGLQTWYKGKTLEEWSATDPKYTDSKTGFSWYVRDGKHPYMVGEEAEKFKEMCMETGESWLKRFAEMTGMIQYLDDNTTAYVGTNGTAIKSKDGRELFIDTSALSYDMIMSLFKNLPKSDNYFDSGYWQENIKKAQFLSNSNAA